MRPALDPSCDEDLATRIKNYLYNRDPSLLYSVDIAVKGDEVVLSGKVKTFHHRQLCISTCQRVAGVIRIVDQIEVTGLPS